MNNLSKHKDKIKNNKINKIQKKYFKALLNFKINFYYILQKHVKILQFTIVKIFNYKIKNIYQFLINFSH